MGQSDLVRVRLLIDLDRVRVLLRYLAPADDACQEVAALAEPATAGRLVFEADARSEVSNLDSGAPCSR
jgi:hypothetical protein